MGNYIIKDEIDGLNSSKLKRLRSEALTYSRYKLSLRLIKIQIKELRDINEWTESEDTKEIDELIKQATTLLKEYRKERGIDRKINNEKGKLRDKVKKPIYILQKEQKHLNKRQNKLINQKGTISHKKYR